MLDKLREVAERYELLEQRMAQPEVYSDPAAYAKLAREQKDLTPLVEVYRRYEKACRDAEGARELMADPDFKEMAQEELGGGKGADGGDRGGAEGAAPATGPQR